LDHNELTQVPTQMYLCTALSELDLSFNLLSGTVATQIAALSNLSLLKLESNHLSGDVNLGSSQFASVPTGTCVWSTNTTTEKNCFTNCVAGCQCDQPCGYLSTTPSTTIAPTTPQTKTLATTTQTAVITTTTTAATTTTASMEPLPPVSVASPTSTSPQDQSNTSSTTTVATTVSAMQQPVATPGNSPTGMSIGIAVGVVALLLIVTGGIWFIVSRRRRGVPSEPKHGKSTLYSRAPSPDDLYNSASDHSANYGPAPRSPNAYERGAVNLHSPQTLRRDYQR